MRNDYEGPPLECCNAKLLECAICDCEYCPVHDTDTDHDLCCEHNEHDHGYCLDCGEDLTNRLAGMAEDTYEGDR